MFNVRLADGHLYGKQLFTWLSLVVSLMASFVLSFFPLDVLDEIWDLIESVSEGFLTYSSLSQFLRVFLPTFTFSYELTSSFCLSCFALYAHLSTECTPSLVILRSHICILNVSVLVCNVKTRSFA